MSDGGGWGCGCELSNDIWELWLLGGLDVGLVLVGCSGAVECLV